MSFYEILMAIVRSFTLAVTTKPTQFNTTTFQREWEDEHIAVARDAMKWGREIAMKSKGKRGFTPIQIREMNALFTECEYVIENERYTTAKEQALKDIKDATWTCPTGSNKFNSISDNGIHIDNVVTMLDELGYAIGQNWDWAGTSETMFVEIF